MIYRYGRGKEIEIQLINFENINEQVKRRDGTV